MENKEVKQEIELTPEVMNGSDWAAKRKYIMTVMVNMGLTNSLEKSEIMQFIDLCCMYALNPLKKEIYVSSFKNANGTKSLSIIVAYQVYLQIANKTGLVDIPPQTKILNEFVVNEKGEFIYDELGNKKKTMIPEILCEFSCKRKDQSEIFKKVFRMKEFHKGQSVWLTMPFFMLEKCAIAGGLRQLFPIELGTMPYIAEEQWGQTLTKVKPIVEENLETSKLLKEISNE